MYMFVKTKTNMKTKLLFAAILCAVCTTLCSAQVSVSKTSRGGLKELKQKDLDLVKSKKTLFVVDDFDLEDFREIATEAWKVTPFELVSREDFQKDKESKYINDTYAIFEMNGHVEQDHQKRRYSRLPVRLYAVLLSGRHQAKKEKAGL